MRRSRLTLSIEYEGATPREFKWSELKAFIDAFQRALRALGPDQNFDYVIPVAIREGSVTTVIEGPAMSKIFNRLKEGPKRTWTSLEREGCDPLYKFLESREATLKGGFRGPLRPVKTPQKKVSKTYKGTTELIVFIQKVGGENPKVHVRMRDGQLRVFSIDSDLIPKVGSMIWTDVRIRGKATWDKGTNALLDFEIREIRKLKKGRISKLLKKNGGKLPYELKIKSVPELIRQRRDRTA